MLPHIKTYQIAEVFYSLQGEGFWSGTPAVFVRFSGCNLKCSWCDTIHIATEELTGIQILHEIRKYPAKIVVFTGGEPLLQLDEELARNIRKYKKVHVETNGTVALTSLYDLIDWLTVSPKQGAPWNQRSGEELKVVYEGQDLLQYNDSLFQNHFLQPCSMKNTSEVIEVCKRNPKWRLSLQTQKMLHIR